MYEILTGPMVWIAFAGLIGGTIYRLFSMATAARREKSVLPIYDARFGARSILHWIVPFAARNMRMKPFFTILSFAFHLCLLATPLLVMGHAVLWEQAWGFSWWSLPPLAADVMTLVVIVGGVMFILRRIGAPEVRNVTGPGEYVMILLVIAPFVTGFVAKMQWLPYDTMITLHIVTGVLWLIAIPFTRLSHALWFVFTRAFMGSEFGKVRNARDW